MQFKFAPIKTSSYFIVSCQCGLAYADQQLFYDFEWELFLTARIDS